MLGVNGRFVMVGISTILIPLGKWVLKRIVGKGIDKLAHTSSARENDSFRSRSEEVREGIS